MRFVIVPFSGDVASLWRLLYVLHDEYRKGEIVPMLYYCKDLFGSEDRSKETILWGRTCARPDGSPVPDFSEQWRAIMPSNISVQNNTLVDVYVPDASVPRKQWMILRCASLGNVWKETHPEDSVTIVSPFDVDLYEYETSFPYSVHMLVEDGKASEQLLYWACAAASAGRPLFLQNAEGLDDVQQKLLKEAGLSNMTSSVDFAVLHQETDSRCVLM